MRLPAPVRALWFMAASGTATLYIAILCMVMAPFDRRDRWFARQMRWLSSVWLRTAGAEIIIESAVPLEELFGRPVFLAGNHQSTLDIPLMALVAGGKIRFFAKSSLFHVPFMGWAMTVKGFTPVYRESARKTKPALDRAVARLRDREASFVIFPEGTRSKTGELLPYRRGAFSLARRAGVPVVPFALEGTGRVMPKGAWGPTPGRVRVVLGAPIETKDLPEHAADLLLEQARTFTDRALADLRRATMQSS